MCFLRIIAGSCWRRERRRILRGCGLADQSGYERLVTVAYGQFLLADLYLAGGKGGNLLQIDDEAAMNTQETFPVQLLFQLADLIFGSDHFFPGMYMDIILPTFSV